MILCFTFLIPKCNFHKSFVPSTTKLSFSNNSSNISARNNVIVSHTSNTVPCTNEDSQYKIPNAASRQTASSKTAVRKIARDPRLGDVESWGVLPNSDGKKVCQFLRFFSQFPKLKLRIDCERVYISDVF